MTDCIGRIRAKDVAVKEVKQKTRTIKNVIEDGDDGLTEEDENKPDEEGGRGPGSAVNRDGGAGCGLQAVLVRLHRASGGWCGRVRVVRWKRNGGGGGGSAVVGSLWERMGLAGSFFVVLVAWSTSPFWHRGRVYAEHTAVAGGTNVAQLTSLTSTCLHELWASLMRCDAGRQDRDG